MGAAPKQQPVTAQSIVEKLDELPTLPSIVYELSRVIGDPMSSTKDVENIMANDQAMTTKVLKLANSAYYAIPGGVSSLQRAIAYIGFDAIQQLVLSASIMKALDTAAAGSFDPKEFWKHSLGVAMASETTARFVHHKTPSDLFTCGLVHDMGKIAIFIIAPDLFAQILENAKTKSLSVLESEVDLESPRHTTIGKELALKWRLPSLIQATIHHHHTKETAARGALSQEMNMVVDIVFLSNLLTHALQFGNSGHNKVIGVPRDVLERLHLTPEKLKELIVKIRESIASAENFLKIIGG